MYNTKLLSPFLTIVLCASLFTACDKPQKPEDNTTPAVKPAPAEGLTTAEKPITTESLATADIPMTEDEVAPPLEAQDIFSGKKVTLKDFQGQVVFLDFWTSWCPPCQEPMRHNQKLMTKHAEDWKGKAAIIGVSLDDLVEPYRSMSRTRISPRLCNSGQRADGTASPPKTTKLGVFRARSLSTKRAASSGADIRQRLMSKR